MHPAEVCSHGGGGCVFSRQVMSNSYATPWTMVHQASPVAQMVWDRVVPVLYLEGYEFPEYRFHIMFQMDSVF